MPKETKRSKSGIWKMDRKAVNAKDIYCTNLPKVDLEAKLQNNSTLLSWIFLSKGFIYSKTDDIH